MRPLKLTMSAFGPYSDKIVIDFDKLGESGIYLITGDTGAGKTTIFDAIVFALYGEASGENRKSFMLRSKYANPETPTYVELIFEYADKIYTVKRNPDYLRPKLRGGGFTNESAGCELILPDGRTIAKRVDADEKIQEIIGISKAQFLQIAMIAQGDFLKLLTASTDSRIEIFRRIFNTSLFSKLQDKIKYDCKVAKSRLDEANKSISQYISGISCLDSSPFFSEIQRAKNNELPNSEVILSLERLIETDENSNKELNLDIEKTEKQLAVVNSNLGKIEEYEKAIKESEKVDLELKVKSDEYEKTEELFKQEKEAFQETKALNDESAKIGAELPRYDELSFLLNKYKKANGELLSKKQILSGKREIFADKKAFAEKLKAEKVTLETAGENKEKLINEKQRAEEKNKTLNDLLAEIKEYFDIFTLLKQKQRIYVNACKIAQDDLETYSRLNKAFLDEQAGILAEQLVENSPCPVCGSTVHPRIAVKSQNAPTESQLKSAKQKSEKTQKIVENESNECASIKGKAENTKANIEKNLKEFKLETDINSAKEKIELLISNQKNLIAKLNNLIAQEEQRVSKKQYLEKLIPETEAQADKLKGEISELEANIASLSAAIEEILSQAENLRKSLRFSDKNFAQKKVAELRAKADKLTKSYENAQKSCENCKQQIIALKASKTQLQKQIENFKSINAFEVKADLKQLTEKKQSLNMLKSEVTARLNANHYAFDNIKKMSDKIQNLESEYVMLKELSETANGNINGKERVLLEAYVQMNYFDRILARANTRLMIMSDGQYEMVRRKTAENKKSHIGLEIDVIDHYNGTQRSVNTLSGGESFKASLSLALGLSDEIQASSGGIKLDTMFVDEGFGSLDDESLNQAMNALKNLTEGNRLVGIISHVNELKERIDRQIVVTKEKHGGSKAEIIV